MLAGIVLPLFCLPWIPRCMQDTTRLASSSLRKSGFLCALRVATMPFTGCHHFLAEIDDRPAAPRSTAEWLWDA